MFLRNEFENRMRHLIASKSDGQIANEMIGGDAMTVQAGKKYMDPFTFDGFRSQLASELLSGNIKENFLKHGSNPTKSPFLLS